MDSARASHIPARHAAVLAAWAIRYSAGRATGSWQSALAMTELVADRLTATERVRVIAEAERARQIAERATGMMRNDGEPEAWAQLIERLSAMTGEGSGEPVASAGRTIALAAVSAVRRACGSDLSEPAPEAEAREVAEAAAGAAPEFSPADRVLLMRDLAEQADTVERYPEVGPFLVAWRDLYETVGRLPLDEPYARLNHLPARLG